MPSWVSAAIFAVLVVFFPYALILKILSQLPQPVASSHKRWPLAVNLLISAVVTAGATVFIHAAYYRRTLDPFLLLLEFLIAALAYVFGLALILRQFAGLYPDFFVTTGKSGLALRKTAYRNVTHIEEVARGYGESYLRVQTSYGLIVPLTLKTRDVPSLYERVKPPL
jgi:hypothetical protein